MDRIAIETGLKELFRGQLFGVLATAGGREPYTSLVAFAENDSLDSLFFLTSRSSRKFHNMTANNAVAMLIDNRSNQPADIAGATATTAVGRVMERQDRARQSGLELLLGKHPLLASFASSPTCALMELVVRRYILVSRFEKVIEIAMKDTF